MESSTVLRIEQCPEICWVIRIRSYVHDVLPGTVQWNGPQSPRKGGGFQAEFLLGFLARPTSCRSAGARDDFAGPDPGRGGHGERIPTLPVGDEWRKRKPATRLSAEAELAESCDATSAGHMQMSMQMAKYC
jgi:hypothetical protein